MTTPSRRRSTATFRLLIGRKPLCTSSSISLSISSAVSLCGWTEKGVCARGECATRSANNHFHTLTLALTMIIICLVIGLVRDGLGVRVMIGGKYMHTYVHAYIHAYMHTYICTYVLCTSILHTYIRTYIQHMYIHMYMHTYVHAYIQHMHIHICVHMYIHTYAQCCEHSALHGHLHVSHLALRDRLLKCGITVQ